MLQWIGKFGCSGRTTHYKDAVDALLQKGVQPDLVACAYLGLREQARDIGRRNPSAFNALDANGVRPLHAAAERGDHWMVQWLCASGADPKSGQR